jgi:hypothetical protein
MFWERHISTLLVLALLGCPRPATVATTEPTEPSPPAPAETASCSDERFADYDWVPDDARLATSIQRRDPELSAALAVLARMGAAPELQLPVSAALDFRNLPLQLGSLDRVLGQLELAPAELVELQSPTGEFVWLWATDCPPPTIAARVLDRYGVMLRGDLERPGLRHGSGSVERFPFDLLALGEHRLALTLLGRGAQVGAWLHGSSSSDEGPGRTLAEIPAAPIRTVLAGEALLTSTSADAPSPTPPRLRRLQVTGTTWNEN